MVTEHDRSAFGVLAEQIVAAREQAEASILPGERWAAQTSFQVDTGMGAQWSRLVTLASDSRALAAAITAQGWGPHE